MIYINVNNKEIIVSNFISKEMKYLEAFEIEKIRNNPKEVISFLTNICLEKNINKLRIENYKIAKFILSVIKNISLIKEIDLNFYEKLDDETINIIINNNNLSVIYCYNWPTNINNVNKQICLKRSDDNYSNKIVIDNDVDLNRLEYILINNDKLKVIEFKNYNKDLLLGIIKYINNRNIIIKISEIREYDDTDIKLFEEFENKYNLKIKYMTKRKKSIEIQILKIGIILFMIACIVLLFFYLKKDDKSVDNSKENINKINEVINKSEKRDDDSKETKEEINNKNESKDPYSTNYANKYSDLLKLNSDMFGYISVNNTSINYPVVQSKDNDYYLDHSFDKSKNNYGWLFVDFRNNKDELSKNTIIYGHTLTKSNLLFSDLKKTLDSSWYNDKNNQIITFSVKENDYKWQIFSIYTIEVTSDYLVTEFYSENSYLKFINMIKDRSINNFNTEVNTSDKILTLSTCYGTSKYRLVVHAKLIK